MKLSRIFFVLSIVLTVAAVLLASIAVYTVNSSTYKYYTSRKNECLTEYNQYIRQKNEAENELLKQVYQKAADTCRDYMETWEARMEKEEQKALIFGVCGGGCFAAAAALFIISLSLRFSPKKALAEQTDGTATQPQYSSAPQMPPRAEFAQQQAEYTPFFAEQAQMPQPVQEPCMNVPRQQFAPQQLVPNQYAYQQYAPQQYAEMSRPAPEEPRIEEKFFYEGKNTDLHVFVDKIVIVGKGFNAQMGEKTVPMSSVFAVHFTESSAMVNGFLSFDVITDSEPDSDASTRAFETTVALKSGKDDEKAIEIKAFIDNIITSR